jgi:predicted ATP-grasp superfamily ATP-dependent carboligase
VRILLSEASGLTARQVATLLGRAGHEVEVLSSTSICLARFTRHVRRVHAVPPFRSDPVAWFWGARRVALERRVDILLPTQEQVAILSALSSELGIPTVCPPFQALRRVFDKLSAFETLQQACVPQPDTRAIHSASDLDAIDWFPAYVKRPIGTAGVGVRRVTGREELREAALALGMEARGVLVQREVAGPLVMVQLIADRGRMIAFHANLRVRAGISGGAAEKESIASPELAMAGERLVASLGWHGPLSLDAILGPDGPCVIDVNPRLVEPMNAWLAGVDLVGATLRLARGESPEPQPAGRPGVRSHQLLLAVLGSAAAAGRLGVVREVSGAIFRSGSHRRGAEELTPAAGDWEALVPLAAAVAATVIRPGAWRWFDRGAVTAYALTPAGWEQVLAAAREVGAGPATSGSGSSKHEE